MLRGRGLELGIAGSSVDICLSGLKGLSWDLGRQILLNLDGWKTFVGLGYKVNRREIS